MASATAADSALVADLISHPHRTNSLSCSVESDSVTLWTVAHQAPLSMGLSRQEYWSGLPCPPPGESSRSRDQTRISCLLHWQAGSLPLAPSGKQQPQPISQRFLSSQNDDMCLFFFFHSWRCERQLHFEANVPKP